MKTKSNNEKVTLILSGGGSWNSYTAGWLRELISTIKPDTIIGSSGGALLGACLLSGIDISSKEIWIKISQKAIKPSRVFCGDIIDTKFLRDISTQKSSKLFSSKTELIISATNNEGGISYFSSRQSNQKVFLKALEATCSIPLCSKPISIFAKKYHDSLASSMPHHHIQYSKHRGDKKIIVINIMRPYPGIIWIERIGSCFVRAFNSKNYQKTLAESFELRDYFGLKEGKEITEINNLFVYQPFRVREHIGFLSMNIKKLQEQMILGQQDGIKMKETISRFLAKENEYA